jgi:hypothetical protein
MRVKYWRVNSASMLDGCECGSRHLDVRCGYPVLLHPIDWSQLCYSTASSRDYMAEDAKWHHSDVPGYPIGDPEFLATADQLCDNASTHWGAEISVATEPRGFPNGGRLRRGSINQFGPERFDHVRLCGRNQSCYAARVMIFVEPENVAGGGRVKLVVLKPVMGWQLPALSFNEYAMAQSVMRDPRVTVEVGRFPTDANNGHGTPLCKT